VQGFGAAAQGRENGWHNLGSNHLLQHKGRRNAGGVTADGSNVAANGRPSISEV
jgi:hypothetical protein